MSVVPSAAWPAPPARNDSTGRLSDQKGWCEPLLPLMANRFQAVPQSQPTAMLDGLLRQLSAMDRPRVQLTPLNGWPEDQLPKLANQDGESYAYAYAHAPPTSPESDLARSRSNQGGSFSSHSYAQSVPTSPLTMSSPEPVPCSPVMMLNGTGFPMPPSGLQVPSNPSNRLRSLSHSNSTPSFARPRSGSYHSARAVAASHRDRDPVQAGKVAGPMLSPPRMTASRSHPGELSLSRHPKAMSAFSSPSKVTSASQLQPFDSLPAEELHWHTCLSPTSASILAGAGMESLHPPPSQRKDRLVPPASPSASEIGSWPASVLEDEEVPKPRFAKLRSLSGRLRRQLPNANVSASSFIFHFVPSDFVQPAKKELSPRAIRLASTSGSHGA